MARQQRSRNRTENTTKTVWRIGIFIAAVAILLLLFLPGRGFFSYRSLSKQEEALRLENQKLSESNKELRAEIERLKSDEQYLEDLARKKYGLLKKNEEVYEFKGSGRKK